MNTQALQQAVERELKDTESRLDSDLYINDAMYNRLTGLAQAYEWVLDQMKQLNENK